MGQGCTYISTGATGTTAVAPKFSDIPFKRYTLTLSLPGGGGRFCPPSQRSQLNFPRGYVPLGHSITTWTRRVRAMVSRISTLWVQHRVKFGTRSCWMPLSGIVRWIMNIQTRFCKGFFPILMHYTTSICSRISIFMTIRALSLSDHLKLSILLHFAHHNTCTYLQIHMM